MKLTATICFIFYTQWIQAADPLEEARKAFARGDYSATISNATNAIAKNRWQEDSHVLHIRALMAQGKYTDPLKVKFPNATPIRSNEKIKFNEVAFNLTSQLNNYKDISLREEVPSG